MSIIVLRSGKESPLASSEIDANFTNLNNEKAPLADPALTGATQVGTDSANYQSLVGAVTTKTPIHSVAGTDTNIALALQSKGTGGIDLVAGSKGINISNGTTVTGITRTAGGTAYSTAPSVIISAPTLATGVQATATCTVTAGVVDTTFTIINAGSGYIEQPTITFSGGGGSGATAYATVGNVATKIQTLSPVLSFNTPAGEAFRITDFSGSSTTGSWGVFGPSISPQLRATSSGGTPVLGTSGTQSLAIGTNSGVSQLVVSHTASAVNYVQVTGAATGASASISAQGSDSNIGLILQSKSASIVFLTRPAQGRSFNILDSVAPANYLQVVGSASTAAPILSAQGTDTNISLQLTPKGTGIVLTNQNTPVVKDATATLLIADVLSQIITSTSATAVTLTLPTGTLTDAGISGGTSAVNTAFEWSIINTGATNAVTLAAGANHTIVGSGTVALSTSARFKTVKTAANTFITYRIA